MISVEAQQQLNELALEYGNRLLNDLKRALEKYRRSGELVESLELTVTKATATEAPKIIVTYADQGYFIGYRNPQWTRLPNIDELKEWAGDVQFSGPVPGYKSGLAPNLPPWKVLERRIWAIAKSKQKFDTHKRRTWKREAKLGKLLSELNTDTENSIKNVYEKAVVDALEGRAQTS